MGTTQQYIVLETFLRSPEYRGEYRITEIVSRYFVWHTAEKFIQVLKHMAPVPVGGRRNIT